MKTRVPFNFYFLVVGTFTVFVILYGQPILKVIFYTTFTFSIIYIQFSRYGCTIEITEKEVVVKYLFPWYKNISVSITQITRVDYQKGFYDLLSSKSIGGAFVFPLYCYDAIILSVKSGDPENLLYIKVNTRLFDLGRFVKTLKSKVSAENK